MTDAPELKPCPFCGSNELSHGWSAPGYDGSMSTGNVECHNCNALIYTQQGECDAIAAWNTRASPVDANKPTPTAVADSAAADSVANADLVEAVARALWPALGGNHTSSEVWQHILDLLPTILDTAAPLIRVQRDAEIAAWLREHAPQWGHEALADAIERGEVGDAE